MGALTSNCKRGDEWFVSNHENASLNSPNFHLSKKPRLSPKQQNADRPVFSSKSAAARVSQYPDVKPPLTRLHAPCRPSKFGSILTSMKRGLSANAKPSEAGKREDSHESMGNILSSRLNEVKSAAFATLRYFSKQIEVIELDKEVENGRVSEECSLEEIEVIEEDEQGGKAREIVPNVIELDSKLLDHGAQPSSSSMVSDLILSCSLVNHGDAVSSLSAYKKLLEKVEKKTTRLNQLGFDIEVHERRRSWFQSMRPKKKPVEEVTREPFIPLTDKEEALVKQAFSSANRRRILVSHENSNLEITGELLQCLRPRAWLNDEVINIYLELLKEREKREPQKFLKCHFFNTFFYKKLISGRGYDYKSVRRWTSRKKLGYDLIECDKIIVPVHKEIHWCLAVINKKEQKFQYLDSLKGRDSKVMEILARYYVDEAKDKSGKDINVSSWELEYVEDLPEQENGYDCGMFMIKYADFYSRGSGLYFNQEHMPYFRMRTAKEVLKLRAD